jgi:SPX domain protein involved in polyphosphate accumulation
VAVLVHRHRATLTAGAMEGRVHGLRRAATAPSGRSPPLHSRYMQGFVRSTTKYWVRQPNISEVKYAVLQHLPVFQFNVNPDKEFPTDAQLINSVYLDNSLAELYHGRLDKRPDAIAMRLRWYGSGDPEIVFVERKTHRMGWKGELSVKERFALKEKHIIPFLENRYSIEEVSQLPSLPFVHVWV